MCASNPTLWTLVLRKDKKREEKIWTNAADPMLSDCERGGGGGGKDRPETRTASKRSRSCRGEKKRSIMKGQRCSSIFLIACKGGKNWRG